MSVFYVTIALGDPQGERFEELHALVDTGATWTWVPSEVLVRLGYKPTLKRRLRTADGRVIERDATEVPIRIGDEKLSSLCIFGDEGSQLLLGAVTLEGFGLSADPVNQRLVPVVGLLMSLFE
ncbi:MAG: clan AA aspartic protease [Dehalococcoidia bacterium]|nr:MAG: clan AA aspartic protease [Dehalococcoidia bacterium]